MYEGPLGLKKPIFGLDIGYQTLKVMQLRGEGPGAKVLSVAETPIPAKSLSKEGVKDKEKIAFHLQVDLLQHLRLVARQL